MDNREIKFRAWNKIDKTMGEPFTLIEAIGSRKINGIDTSEIIYQQFTGLLDENGVEIYEDDIVKAELVIGGEDFGFVDVVVYEDFRFRCPDLSDFEMDMYNFKVVGNKHQNHELLK